MQTTQTMTDLIEDLLLILVVYDNQCITDDGVRYSLYRFSCQLQIQACNQQNNYGIIVDLENFNFGEVREFTCYIRDLLSDYNAFSTLELVLKLNLI